MEDFDPNLFKAIELFLSEESVRNGPQTQPKPQDLGKVIEQQLKNLMGNAAPDFGRPPTDNHDDGRPAAHPGYSREFYNEMERRNNGYPPTPESGIDPYGRKFFPFPLGLRMVFRVVEATKAPFGANTFPPDDRTSIDIKRGKEPTFYVRPTPGEDQTQRGGLPKVAEFLVNQLPGGSEAAKEVKQEIIHDVIHLMDYMQTDSQGNSTPDDKETAKHIIDTIASKLKIVCGSSTLHAREWYRAIDNATLAALTELTSFPSSS